MIVRQQVISQVASASQMSDIDQGQAVKIREEVERAISRLRIRSYSGMEM